MDLRRPPVLLFDDSLAAPEEAASLLFHGVHSIVRADSLAAVAPALRALDQALADGFHVAGYIAYEAAAAFEPRLEAALGGRATDGPLLWFGVFPAPRPLTGADVARLLEDAMGGSPRRARLHRLSTGESETEYRQAIERIMAHLEAGDVYQINHVFPLDFRLEGDSLALFAALRRAQPVSHGAFIDTGALTALSLSPELFLRCRNGRLEARPMKGTAERGPDRSGDDLAAEGLSADEKSRAENLMIVDLLRNDLSRIAKPGSVSTPRLFEVERYPSLLQMTSTIQAERRDDCRFSDIVRAMFPCGSITGAPKIRAMEIIADTETAPRGLYTGAIGWAAPDGDMAFSVAIRTLVGRRDGHYRLGIGSGIVADSDWRAEYRECFLKARFLDAADSEEFSLLETMYADKTGGARESDRHLARLEEAAAYFGFRFDRQAILGAIADALEDCDGPMRLRLLLAHGGDCAVTLSPFTPWPAEPRLAIADRPLDAGSPFVRFKTTRRDHYEGPLQRAMAEECADEIMFFNALGQVTEGARSSIFVEIDGALLTPARACGLLPGIFRQALIDSGAAREAVLTIDDCRRASRILIGNSLRGIAPARLFPP